MTVRRCVARRRIRHGGDLQGGVICRRCNAKAVNLAGGEVRCGEIGAVLSSAETSEAVKCSARPRMHRLATVHAHDNQPTNDQRRHNTAYLMPFFDAEYLING